MPKTTYNNRFKLTPMPATNRWRKIYHSKCYYVGVGHCSSKTDRVGYQFALAEWRELKDKLDNTPTQVGQHLYDLVQARGEVAAEIQSHLEAADDATLDWLREHDDRIRKGIDQFREQRTIEQVVLKVEGKPSPKANTVGSLVDEFLATKLSRHNLGLLSTSRIIAARQHLNAVEQVWGRDMPASSINDEAVKAYWEALGARVKAGSIQLTTMRDRWMLFREWLTTSLENPPRTLSSRNYSITLPQKEVVVWTEPEFTAFRQRAQVAGQPMELWILLMLNCGM